MGGLSVAMAMQGKPGMALLYFSLASLNYLCAYMLTKEEN